MRIKILILHKRDKFSKKFVDFVKENMFEKIDIYYSDNTSDIEEFSSNFILADETYREVFLGKNYPKLFFLTSSDLCGKILLHNEIYKYKPVKEIIDFILKKDIEYSSEMKIFSITSYQGGVGKTKIYNFMKEKNFFKEKSTIFLSLDFFNKFEKKINDSYFSEFIYYFYLEKNIPTRVTNKIRENIFKYNMMDINFSGDPKDFEKIDKKFFYKLINYFKKEIGVDNVIIDCPAIYVNITKEIIKYSDFIFLVIDLERVNNLEDVFIYFDNSFKNYKYKIRYLINKSRDKLINDNSKKNKIFLPYIEENKDNEEFKKCLKKIREI